MIRNFCLMLCLATILLPLTLVGQVQNENLANGILAARKKEATLLAFYNWNCRTEITQNGTLQDLRLDLVTCNPDGSLQRTLLNDQQGQLPNGFFRKMIAENQRKQVEKYVTDLRGLVDQYTLPSAGAVINFLASASVQPITTPSGQTMLQVVGSSVVIPGDSFIMTVDGRTLAPTSLQITTTYNGDPVTLTASFKAMRAGPNHLQFATVELPAKNVTVTIHNYDYVQND